jgi:hypothetical protein
MDELDASVRHTVVLPYVVHFGQPQDEQPKLVPGGSRWGHGGVYTVRPEDAVGLSLGVPYVIPGPLRVYSVQDCQNRQPVIWMGDGNDDAFNELLRTAANDAGYPTDKPAFGYWEEQQRIEEECKATGATGSRPDSWYWIHYAHGLQSRLRARLEEYGFDGVEVGGEVVVWNYDRLSEARPLTVTDREAA